MDVAAIQRALSARGYYVGPIGEAGPQTIAAVQSFQRVSGLVPDGIAGPLTIKALKSVVPTELRRETPEPPWLVLARGEIGTVEGIGSSDNPKVLAYFRDAGFPGIRDDAVAWCAAFVGAELHRAGFKPSGSLAARSYETWGVGLKEPRLGCVGVKRRGTGWQGHVGFVVGASTDKVFLLGGNQGDKVSIAAFTRHEFTEFRWPSNLPVPDAARLPTTIAGAREGVSEA